MRNILVYIEDVYIELFRNAKRSKTSFRTLFMIDFSI